VNNFISSITINQGSVTHLVFSPIAPADLPASGVVPGGYTTPNLVIDQFGRVTSATSNPAGTVTTVSVVTANGVSGSVANPTTAPAITISLGAITPTSVNASGTVSGSNLSGTNTGDQTITLTGNVTGSGAGSFATTIAAGAVTVAMLAAAVTLDAIASANATAGDVSLNSHKLTNVTDPASAQDAATKNYVDTQLALQVNKQSCQTATVTALAAATYANGSSGVGATLTLNVAAVLILDGYTPALNDRILVKNQADAKQNGIYFLSRLGTLSVTAILTRSLDFDQAADGIDGAFVFVQNGTVNGSTGWLCNTFGSITFGTTLINWTQDTGSGTYTGTAPIAVSAANVISLGALTALSTTSSFGYQDWLVEYNLISAANLKGTVELFLLGIGRGMIDGFVLSNDGVTPLTVLDIAAGTCADSTNIAILKGTAFTKNCNASWAAGSGSGGNFLNTTLAASTWYHVFAIRKDADLSVDYGIDTSISAANIPAGYTYFRRLGSVKTDGSNHLLPFHQYGNEFWWDTSVLDITVTNPGSAAVTRTLGSVPTGLKVKAIVTMNCYSSTINVQGYVSSLDSADLAVSFANAIESAAGDTTIEGLGASLGVWTNTSAQIRSRLVNSDANTSHRIRTLGWIDPRGRDS